jgi:ankyrin repeat protein
VHTAAHTSNLSPVRFHVNTRAPSARAISFENKAHLGNLYIIYYYAAYHSIIHFIHTRRNQNQKLKQHDHETFLGLPIRSSKLFASGGDVNKCHNDGVSPIYVAAFNGHAECLKLLLAAGGDVNKCSKAGFSPIDKAKEGCSDVKKLLQDAGCKAGPQHPT